MKAELRKILVSGAILGLFSVVGIGLVATVHESTRERRAANQRQNLIDTLQHLVPVESYDNDILTDAIEINDPALSPRAAVAYRARKAGEPVAVVLTPVAPDGYAGEIRLLVAIKGDGGLAGVRVLGHKETPGLGDLIDESRSNWIFGFDGLSLANPPATQWKVKKDGGSFDQFAGATVTPRAVVKAVKKSLLYFDANRTMLFAAQPQDAGLRPGTSK